MPPETRTESLLDRVRKLGFAAAELSTDRVSSTAAALACLPMYMVANVHAWTGDKQFHIPFLDLPGAEQVMEAFAIGKQEAQMGVSDADREILGKLLRAERPADRIIYEYGLDTLALFLDEASPDVAAALRMAVAQMVVAVAQAAGKGPLGSGRKVTNEERACIGQISSALRLNTVETAAAALATLEDY